MFIKYKKIICNNSIGWSSSFLKRFRLLVGTIGQVDPILFDVYIDCALLA